MTLSREMIDLALGFDSNYAPHAAATIASALQHSPGARFRFTILHDGVAKPARDRIQSVARGMEHRWVEVGEQDLPPITGRGYFSRANLFRLGLERHAPPDCRRIIYLDADAIVCSDLRHLWRVDLEGAPIGAAHDTFTKAEDFARAQNLPAPRAGYFNAGVLLVDLERVRAESLFANAIDVLRQRLDAMPFLDQDALNIVCWERWKPLPMSWNVQRLMTLPHWAASLPAEMRLNGAPPDIIHFTAADKPWMRSSYHPWAWAYWENLARTPFLAEVAAEQGVDALQRLRLRLRWLRHRPRRRAEASSARQ